MKFTTILLVSAPLLAVGSNSTAKATVSKAAILNSIADAEQQLARSGHGVVQQAAQVKEEVSKALGKSNPLAALKVEELMNTLGRQERGIMKSEAAEAKRDRLEAQGREPHASFAQQSVAGRATLANAAAKRAVNEVHNVAANLHIVKELDVAKNAIAKALGKKAPGVEAEVEKYLNLAEHTESHLAHHEFKRVGKLIGQAEHAGVTLNQLKRMGMAKQESDSKAKRDLPTHHTRSVPAMAQVETTATSGKVQDMADLADKELRQARESAEKLQATKELDRKLVSDLAKKEPANAKRFMRLLSKERRAEAQEVRKEFHQAKKDWQRAVATESEKFQTQHKKHQPKVHAQHSHGHHSRSTKVNANAKAMANFADKEVRIANNGLRLYEQMEKVDRAVQVALEHPSRKRAQNAKRLLKLMEREQGQEVWNEYEDANREWRKAVATESRDLHRKQRK